MSASDWRPVKLDELGHVGRGKSRHRPRNAAFLYGGRYPFFQTGDIKAANFYLNEYSQTYSEEGLAQSKLWKPGTLCITIAANIAESAILGIEGCFPDSVVGFVADPAKADVRFVKYYLEILKLRMQNVSHGATQDNLSVDKLLSFNFLAPPLPIQQRIAGILSTYDELIENSKRRIKILESMVRTIYREWFVHFRFPGHEKYPRVASALGDIPQGWEVKEMREVADVIDCLHSKKPTECPNGPGIFLQLNNIGEGGKLDLSEQFRISADDYAQWISRIELRAGDCVITNVGRVGAVGQVPQGVKAAPGRNMTAIRPRAGQLTPTYLIEYLLSSHMTAEVAKKKDLGTIMDSLNVKGIIRLHVPCPPFGAMQRFEEVARPIRKRIELLVEQIENLRRTRDLLLPRLLSGQIEIGNN
jgi:type I restriction enzyme S subunit